MRTSASWAHISGIISHKHSWIHTTTAAGPLWESEGLMRAVWAGAKPKLVPCGPIVSKYVLGPQPFPPLRPVWGLSVGNPVLSTTQFRDNLDTPTEAQEASGRWIFFYQFFCIMCFNNQCWSHNIHWNTRSQKLHIRHCVKLSHIYPWPINIYHL